jgi:hypothetical protein
MNPPVDPVEQFFSMFAQANTAVWPMHVVWYAAALAAIGPAIRPTRNSSRLIAGFLAVYYAWLGIVFFGRACLVCRPSRSAMDARRRTAYRFG